LQHQTKTNQNNPIINIQKLNTMKAVKFFAAALILVVLTSTVKAGDDTKAVKSQLTQKVTEMVKFPEFAQENLLEGFVYVEFKVSEEGKIEVVRTNTLEPELANYVKEKLQQIVLDSNDVATGKTHYMKFDFRLEK